MIGIFSLALSSSGCTLSYNNANVWTLANSGSRLFYAMSVTSSYGDSLLQVLDNKYNILWDSFNSGNQMKGYVYEIGPYVSEQIISYYSRSERLFFT